MSAYHHENPTLDLSVVVPIYNERDNAAPLAEDIIRAVEPTGKSFEVVLVNDGSNDGTDSVLDEIAAKHKQVRIIHFAGNRGQTIAMAAGMYYSVGKVIVTMDGDRQNDPTDIPALLERLEQGFDCVSGWRRDRQDTGPRRFVSRVANRIVRKVTGVPVHDLGCTLKAYSRRALDPTELFGEMHRFLAVYVLARGGKISEMVVKHHPRTAGTSKYGMSRTARVMADILLIRILHKYRTRPSHMFAKVAQYMFLGAIGFGFLWLITLLRGHSLAAGSTWFISAVVLSASAVNILVAGLVAELVMRTKHALSGQRPWNIDRIVGGPDTLEVTSTSGVSGTSGFSGTSGV
ncbi:MAG TPA: glycosyltransferase family 2 protein [Phycisphaerae bacterium]|nr:glycosyltransferase family 2 protein [Phycisphaerae bacterium]